MPLCLISWSPYSSGPSVGCVVCSMGFSSAKMRYYLENVPRTQIPTPSPRCSTILDLAAADGVPQVRCGRAMKGGRYLRETIESQRTVVERLLQDEDSLFVPIVRT